MSAPRTSRLLLRAGAVAGVALFIGWMARFWHPVYGFTAFLQVGTDSVPDVIEAFREYPVYFYETPDSYDGLHYAQLACHPWLDSAELPAAIDNLPYRARRILLPAAAWALAAGREGLIPNVYAGLNLVCWLALAWLLWRVLPVRDFRGLAAWAGVLFSAGALGSVRFALADLPALLLIAAAVWAAERARLRAALGWLAAAILTRETALMAWPGFCTGPWNSWRRVARDVALGAAAAVPLAAWLVYIRWSAGAVNEGWANFAWPGAGWLGRWTTSLGEVIHGRDQPYSWGTILAVASLTAQAAFVAAWWRPGDRWWRIGAAHVLLLLVLGTPVWSGFPIAATRVLLPLTLACNLLTVRFRAPVAWLLACNLTVVSGFLAVWSVPRHAGELAAARSGAAAAVVELGRGWYGQEQDAHHRWEWTEAGGRLTVLTWPRSSAVTVRLHLGLRGINARTVIVRADGREIWRGPAGAGLTLVSLPAQRVRGGRLELEFATDAPPERETPGPQPRLLGFALYDPVLSVSLSGAADP